LQCCPIFVYLFPVVSSLSYGFTGLPITFEYCCRQSIHCSSSPELKPIEKIKYKITTKSRTELRLLEPLLIANYSRLFQRQALLAAILLLALVLLFAAII